MENATASAVPSVDAPVSFKGYRFPFSLRMVEEMLAARAG